MNYNTIPGLDRQEITTQIMYAKKGFITSDYILKKIAEYFIADDGVQKTLLALGYVPNKEGLIKAIKDKTRKREIIIARQAFCYFSKQLTNNTLKIIGKYLGQRDHSTVIHSIQVWDNLKQVDSTVKQYDKQLKNIFGV